MASKVNDLENGHEVIVDDGKGKFNFVFRKEDGTGLLIETAWGFKGEGPFPDDALVMAKRCKAIAALEREGKANLKLTGDVARAYKRRF